MCALWRQIKIPLQHSNQSRIFTHFAWAQDVSIGPTPSNKNWGRWLLEVRNLFQISKKLIFGNITFS